MSTKQHTPIDAVIAWDTALFQLNEAYNAMLDESHKRIGAWSDLPEADRNSNESARIAMVPLVPHLRKLAKRALNYANAISSACGDS